MNSQLIKINSELKRVGVKQKDIAEMLGISAPAVNQVMAGVRHTPRVQKAISFAVGMPLHSLFNPKPTRRGKRS